MALPVTMATTAKFRSKDFMFTSSSRRVRRSKKDIPQSTTREVSVFPPPAATVGSDYTSTAGDRLAGGVKIRDGSGFRRATA